MIKILVLCLCFAIQCYAQLAWSCSDPDGDPLTYDVYFGTDSSNLPLVSFNQSDTFYVTNIWLNYKTTYYWKVVARDDSGATTSGPIWRFSTLDGFDPLGEPKPYLIIKDILNIPINLNNH